jgi:hypothetical protein
MGVRGYKELVEMAEMVEMVGTRVAFTLHHHSISPSRSTGARSVATAPVMGGMVAAVVRVTPGVMEGKAGMEAPVVVSTARKRIRMVLRCVLRSVTVRSVGTVPVVAVLVVMEGEGGPEETVAVQGMEAGCITKVSL